jgi:hypothetical protein
MPRRRFTCDNLFSPEDADLHNIPWWKDGCGYAVHITRTAGKVLAHHAVSLRKYGRRPDWSKHETIDHINGNKLDNRRENLEMVSLRENVRRQHGSKNPMWASREVQSKNKWRYQINLSGKYHYKGGFNSAEEAHEAAKALLKAHESRNWPDVSEEDREEALANLDAAIASTPPEHPDHAKLTALESKR